MICAKVFIKKEIREIMNSKRLLLALAVGGFSCLIENIVSIMPGSHTLFSLEIERILLCMNYFVVYLSSDIIFVTMVEEVTSGTFDMIRMSKCSRNKIILFKCMMPIIISVFLFLLNIVTNNVSALIFKDLVMINVCEVSYWLIALFALIGCTLFEFVRCISSKQYLPTDNNYLSLFITGIYASLFYISKWYLLVSIIAAICITSLIYGYTLWKMKRLYITGNKKDKFQLGNIIKISDGNYVKTIISRELKRFLAMKREIFTIIYCVISSLVIFCIMPQSVYRRCIMCVVLYILALSFSGHIFLESIKEEVYEKMNEILLLANISKRINYKLCMIFSLALGVLAGSLLGIGNFILVAIGVVDRIWFENYILYFLILFVSMFVSYIFSYKYFVSIKDIKFVKRYLYFVTSIVYVLLCLLTFTLMK